MDLETAREIYKHQQSAKRAAEKADVCQEIDHSLPNPSRKSSLRRFDELFTRVSWLVQGQRLMRDESGALRAPNTVKGTNFAPEIPIGKLTLRLSVFKGEGSYANMSSIAAYWGGIDGGVEHIHRRVFIGRPQTQTERQSRVENRVMLDELSLSVDEYERHAPAD